MRIHYNATGEKRKEMVKTIGETIGVKPVYMKTPTYAFTIDYFTVTRDGTLEFSDRSDSEEVEAVLEALEAAGFEGVGETVEAPETPTVAGDKPQERDDGQDAGEKHEAIELKVTLPLARHTGMSLRNLINLVYTRAPLLNKALGTALRVDEGLVQALRDNACVLTRDRLFETVEAYENRHGKAADGICVGPDTITFSTLPETDDPDVIRAFTTLCAMMNKQALAQTYIKAKVISEENEKYAMHIWMQRMGMKGAEYKTERRILMEKLSGHCAFRTEQVKMVWQQRQNEKRDALRAAKLAAEVKNDDISAS